MVANVKQAWREAESITMRNLKRAAEGLPEEDLDDPLREAVESSLKETFKREYSILLPASWMGVPSLTGRLHREFQKRSHVASKVDRIKRSARSQSQGRRLNVNVWLTSWS